MDYLALDPGTHKMGVALFVENKLSAWWLIEPTGDIENRIPAILNELTSILDQYGRNVSQVVCERNKGIEKRFPAPELQTLIRRLKRWATAGRTKNNSNRRQLVWVEYSTSSAVASVRPLRMQGNAKTVMKVGVGMLYHGAALAWQGELDTRTLPEDVIDAIAVGHCHKVKQELPDEIC